MKLSEAIHNISYEHGVLYYDHKNGHGSWHKLIHRQRLSDERKMSKLLFFLHAMLRYGIDPYVAIPTPVQYVAPSVTTQHAPIQNKEPDKVIVPETILTDDSDTYQGKELIARTLYKYAGRKRAELHSNDREVRKQAALFITKAMKRNRQLWDELNYYSQHGKFPEKQTADALIDVSNINTVDAMRIVRNLRPWLSKEKKKIANETDEAKRKERIAKFDEQTKILKALEHKLNELA